MRGVAWGKITEYQRALFIKQIDEFLSGNYEADKFYKE